MKNPNQFQVNIFDLGAAQDAQQTTVNINGTDIAVSRTIPHTRVVDAIEWAVNTVLDDRPFVSAPMAEIIETITLLRFYTNIDFAEIDNADFSVQTFYQWYDQIKAFNIDAKVRAEIDTEQKVFLCRALKETLTSIVAYRNSTAGILEALSSQKAETTADLEEMIQTFLTSESGGNLQTIIQSLNSLNK